MAGRSGTHSEIVRPGGREGGGGGIRYTDILVTINTNRKPYSPEEEGYLYDTLERIIREEMMTEKGLREVLPMDNPDSIQEVIMSNWSIETGKKPRGGRVHAHFILNIAHNGNFLLRYANKRFKVWFDGKFPWFTGQNGCNAQVILLKSSRLKNYIAKTGHNPPAPVLLQMANDQ
jgi:hypothetical protein